MNYKSTIIIRYDGKNQQTNKVFGVGIEFNKNQWYIIDTSENIFSKENVLGILKHSINKFNDKNFIILHNNNKELLKILNNLPYPHSSLYDIFSDKQKKEYEFMENIYKKNSKGPELNSTKNMNIDISFFYKNFFKKPISCSKETLLKNNLKAVFFSSYYNFYEKK